MSLCAFGVQLEANEKTCSATVDGRGALSGGHRIEPLACYVAAKRLDAGLQALYLTGI